MRWQVHLLCGAVLPIWIPLQRVLSRQATLSVRRTLVEGKPIIGIFLEKQGIESLKKQEDSIEIYIDMS